MLSPFSNKEVWRELTATLRLPFVYFDKALISASETSADLIGPASLRTDELIKGTTTLVPLLALLDTACTVVAKAIPKIVKFDRVETCQNTLRVFFHRTCQSPG